MRRVAVLAAVVIVLVPASAGAQVQTTVTGVNLVGGNIQVVGGTSYPQGGFGSHPFIAYYELAGDLLSGRVYESLSGTFQESYVDAQGVTHAVTTIPGQEPVYTRLAADGTVVPGLGSVDLGAGVTNLSQPFEIVPVGSSSVVFLNHSGQILARWIDTTGSQSGGQTFQYPPNTSTVGNSAFRGGSNIVVVGNAGGDGMVLSLTALEATTTLTPDNNFAGDGWASSTTLDDIGTGVRASYPPAADKFVFFGAATAGGIGQEAFGLSGTSLGAAVSLPGLSDARKALQLGTGTPLHVGGWAPPAMNTSQFRIGHSIHPGGGAQSGFTASTPFNYFTIPEDFALTQDGRLAVGSTDIPQPGVPAGVVSLFNGNGTPHTAFGGTGHVRINPGAFPDPGVNDPPVILLPPAPTIAQGETLTMGNPISIADPDAGNDEVRVTLSTTPGTLTLAGTTGLTFLDGTTGTDAARMRFTGTLANVNSALNGLRYKPPPDFSGTAVIGVTVNDQGNNGTGGAQQDSNALPVTVTPAQSGGNTPTPPETNPVGYPGGLIPSGGADCDWDWKVTISPTHPDIVLQDRAGLFAVPLDRHYAADWWVGVQNVGLCQSPPTRFQFRAVQLFDGLPPLAYRPLYSNQHSQESICAELVGGEVSCPVPALKPGKSMEPYFMEIKKELPLDGEAKASVACNVAGENARCDNNEALARFRQFFEQLPGTATASIFRVRDQPASKVKQFSGRGDESSRPKQVVTAAARRRGVRKIQIALVRQPDGTSPKCRWLASNRARFRDNEPAGDNCVDPVWLTAKGTKRWVYKLKKTLPKGSYLLYARAFDSKNRPQVTFDRRNKVAFKLR